jgi:hypothetical protein
MLGDTSDGKIPIYENALPNDQREGVAFFPELTKMDYVELKNSERVCYDDAQKN